MKVSTVTPSYNQGQFSTDNTVEVLKSFQPTSALGVGEIQGVIMRTRWCDGASSRNDNAAFFAVKVGMVSVLPALKCNWGVSAEMRKTVYSWITF